MKPTHDDETQCLNLAHQFLDTNFIESTRCDNFNILPVISTNPSFESFVRSDPPLAVDYFSYDLTSKQYHSCWKNISNNQFMKPYELSNVDNITRLRTVQQTDDLMMFLPTTSQARLENACWRAWYKKLRSLKELDPTEINWFKENDVTVLYGPLIDDADGVGEKKKKKEQQQQQQQVKNSTRIFDCEGDCKMAEAWNSDYSSSSTSENENENENENDSDSDSLLIQRHYSLESASTSISSFSNSKAAPKTAVTNAAVTEDPTTATIATDTTDMTPLPPPASSSSASLSSSSSSSSSSFIAFSGSQTSLTNSTSNTDLPDLSPPALALNGKQLKSILKKRRNLYVGKTECKGTKKRISFSQELSSVRFIV